MEFLQAITVLYNNYLRKGDLRYMLSPACFLPLMNSTPISSIHLKNILVITRHIASEMISLFLHVTNLFVLYMMITIILHIFTITYKPSIGLSAFHIRIFYLTMRISPLYVKKKSATL